MFKVIGGEYCDTSFTKTVAGTAEEHGPFQTYQEALDKWRARSWSTVDNCHYRFFIKETDHAAQ